MKNNCHFHVAAAGMKGLTFLQGLQAKGYTPARVFSYEQKDDESNAFTDIKLQCQQYGSDLVEDRRPEFIPEVRTFLIGWQYLFSGSTDKVVVFHDSLLPDLRGFAPTVTALITGRGRLGVTAFQPDNGVDTGPIYLQDGFDVTHPLRVSEALKRQAELMAALAAEILAADAAGAPLSPETQDESGATYSIWRDELDFRLDPSMSAAEIVRRVYALGYPYQGAQIQTGESLLIVHDAIEVEELNFAIRDVGKIWRIDPDGPVMICGQGMVKFTDLKTQTGEPWSPQKLRMRFVQP